MIRVILIFLLVFPVLSTNAQKRKSRSQISGMSGNTELRVLYVGYTNKISVFTSGLSDSAEVKCDGCNNLNKTEDEGVYVVTVSDEMPTVRIYVEDKEITKQKASEDFSWTYRVI